MNHTDCCRTGRILKIEPESVISKNGHKPNYIILSFVRDKSDDFYYNICGCYEGSGQGFFVEAGTDGVEEGKRHFNCLVDIIEEGKFTLDITDRDNPKLLLPEYSKVYKKYNPLTLSQTTRQPSPSQASR